MVTEMCGLSTEKPNVSAKKSPELLKCYCVRAFSKFPDCLPACFSQRDDGAAPRQAAAEGDQKNRVARLAAAGAQRLVQSNGHARRRGVPVLVQVHHHLVTRELARLQRRVDDPLVHL